MLLTRSLLAIARRQACQWTPLSALADSHVEARMCDEIVVDDVVDVPKQNTDKVKKYILLMFNILFTKSMDIYKLLTSPDIDPSEFSKAIINLTNSFKSQIPGCDRAFKKINESVDKLTASIGTYYKTLIITKDPTILVKSFFNLSSCLRLLFIALINLLR